MEITDTDSNFTSDGIAPGDIVHNATDDWYTVVRKPGCTTISTMGRLRTLIHIAVNLSKHYLKSAWRWLCK